MSRSSSETSSLTSYARRLSVPKSHVDIHLDNNFTSKTFTSGSPLSGHVTITTARSDLRYESLQIVLVGTVGTRLDSSAGPAISQAFTSHVFLKMPMPIPESTYPHPRVLEPGHPLNVPFNFVIPSFLTVEACKHKVSSDAVRDAHICIPPTLGGDAPGKDDMAPQMAKVTYSVKARLWGEQDEYHPHGPKLLEAAREIRVLPATPEQPPLSVGPKDKLYTLSKTKTLRRGLFAGKKVGQVTASASQPAAARLTSDGQGMVAPTKASVELEFEPSVEGQEPPRVVCVQAKVGVHTYFSDAGMGSFADREHNARGRSFINRGHYSTSVGIPTRAVEGVRWNKARPYNPMERRDSGYMSDSPEDESPERSSSVDSRSQPRMGLLRTSERSGSSTVFTSKVDVPIILPLDKKAFPPTFHSCTASRVYTLQVALTLATGEGKSASASTISLTLPLQVIVDAAPIMDSGDQAPPSFETALQEAEADAMLLSRVGRLSRQEEMAQLVRVTSGGLPGYDDI